MQRKYVQDSTSDEEVDYSMDHSINNSFIEPFITREYASSTTAPKEMFSPLKASNLDTTIQDKAKQRQIEGK